MIERATLPFRHLLRNEKRCIVSLYFCIYVVRHIQSVYKHLVRNICTKYSRILFGSFF